MSLSIQVKLLRAVQEKVVRPLGGTEDVCVDIRIVSATNKSLEKEVIAGKFREGACEVCAGEDGRIPVIQ